MIDRLRRIALAVDRSEESDHACDLAARLSVDTGAPVVIIHVRSTHPLLRGDAVNPGQRETMEREGQEFLDEQRARVEQAGGTVEDTRLGFGKRIDETIVRGVEDLDADLLVVGGRGEDEVTRRMLLGSTSESLVRHAPCSVLVARRPLGADT